MDALWFEELLGTARAALREADARAGSESISRALGLWRGPALQGLTDTPWLRAEAQRTVTYLLGALVDKSIVLVSFPEEQARYDLLDTVRD